MSNVEIYGTSNSDLSSDEYSHEEDDDALMEAAVSKQASPGNTPMKAGAGEGAVAKPEPKTSENRDDGGGPIAADASGKDKKPVAVAAVIQEPPSTSAEAFRQIRQFQAAPFPSFQYYKRRCLLVLKQKRHRREQYMVRAGRKKSCIRLSGNSSESRSVSYSRSNSRSLSRSLSRSRSCSYERSHSSDPDPSRSGSQSPELICLDDTENEDSPEKPDEAKAADVTPIKENKAKIIRPSLPAQPQLEQQQQLQQQGSEKSSENGTSSVLEEFLMLREHNLAKLTTSSELEQAIADTTLVQQDEQMEENMAVNATHKRRRSVTPPLSNEKRPKAEAFNNLDEDDTIEFLSIGAQKSVEATPLIKAQPPGQPPKASVVAKPMQSQPAFRLSTPYTLTPEANTKQAINLSALSHSLNTPTPPAMAMEISYPTDSLPHIPKSSILLAPPETETYGSPSYATPLQLAPPQAAHAQVGPIRGGPPQDAPPRPAVPQAQAVTTGTIQQAPFGTQRVLQAQVGPPRALQSPVGPPRAAVQLQAAGTPRAAVPLQAEPTGHNAPQYAATATRPVPQQLQQPAQVHQEQPQVPVNIAGFAVPHQPQPRRSETVSTQTQCDQPEAPPPTVRQKSPPPDLKNSDATFHYRLKELFSDYDEIFRDRIDVGRADRRALIEDINRDVKTLEKLMDEKEDEWNRLFHLRCMKMELRGRVEQMERMSLLEKLVPIVMNKGYTTAELFELNESFCGKNMSEMALKARPSLLEQCLSKLEITQTETQWLRDVLGSKEEARNNSYSNFEEPQQQQQHNRRNSLPVRQETMRDHRNAAEEPQQREYYDMPPASKRPRTLRAQDRYAHEMTNSTPNLSAAASSSRNKVPASGKHRFDSLASLDNPWENESEIRPLYNSSPMFSQRTQAKKQYDELHSTTYRKKEEEDLEYSGSSNLAKALKKSKRVETSTTNGKDDRLCHHCQVYEAIFKCSICLKQCYCSSKCQLLAWGTHQKSCGKK